MILVIVDQSEKKIFGFLIDRKFASSCVYWINADIKMSLEKLDTKIEKSEKNYFHIYQKNQFLLFRMGGKKPPL